jgi:hypothetical protein
VCFADEQKTAKGGRLVIRPYLFVLLAIPFASPLAWGQSNGSDFSLTGLLPIGPRTTVTESWSTLRFDLVNRATSSRDVRVVVFYPSQPNVQFGRDLWLPPESIMSSWLTVGEASGNLASLQGRELKFQLYDRTDGTPRVILPNEDDRLRSRAVPYRKREATTCVLSDELATDEAEGEAIAKPDSNTSQIVQFVRVYRHTLGLSESVTVLADRFLPPAVEAFDGIDHFVLAGNRLQNDTTGMRALRNWIQRGGICWVMLDRVDPASVVPLLGDDCGFTLIDRTSLNTVRLTRPEDKATPPDVREFDRPIPLARVRLGGAETVHLTTDGWPVAFSQTVGRGKIVFTTLDGRAWYRPRMPRERRSTHENYPDLPVATAAMERLVGHLLPFAASESFAPADLHPLNSAEIGYSVVSQSSAAVIFVLFIASIACLGFGIRQTRRPELIGWIAPAIALGVAGVFAGLGFQSRHATPATVALAAIADVQPGTRSGSLAGVVATYQPESGENALVQPNGGLYMPDASGLDGQVRKLIQTDTDSRMWDQLLLPVGVRMGPYRGPVDTGTVTAHARFGPDGLAGRLSLERYPTLTDALLVTNESSVYGVSISANGDFLVRPDDRLKPGQYVTGTVVTDRQKRRQDVLRRYLNPYPKHLAGRPHILAWTESPGDFVSATKDEQVLGNVLLTIPLTLNRTMPETSVVVPQGFIEIGSEGQGRLTVESYSAAEKMVRFRLPPSAIPMDVERATLSLTIRARGRTVSISGFADGKPVPLHEVTNPIDPIRIDITDRSLLRPDADGSLRFQIRIGDRANATLDVRDPEQYASWRIESLGLDVTGRTQPSRNGK